MIKFPKIKQFKDVVHRVRAKHDYVGEENGEPIFRHTSPYPTIKFIGTPKIHGTNGGIRIQNDHTIVAQSRNRDLTVDSDNLGFAKFVAELPDEVIDQLPIGMVIYGEWCGKGVQSGVAISELDRKIFVIFGMTRIDFDRHIAAPVFGEKLTEIMNRNNIYSITQFPSYEIEIDFNEPEAAADKLQEITNNVEKECPVGKFFGISGVGEGVVWTPADRDGLFQDTGLWMKVKGEKHSVRGGRKVAVDPEKLETIKQFTNLVVTENRLKQGIEFLKENNIEISKRNTGKFFKWLVNDVLSEESDVIEKSGLEKSEVTKAINNAAKKFWFSECEKVR